MPPAKTNTNKSFIEKGMLINLEKGGRTLQNLEVLDWDDRFIKLRWDIHSSPQTEVVLIPWEGAVIGLVGER